MPPVTITPIKKDAVAEPVQPEQQVSVVKEVFDDATPWYQSNAIDTETHPPESLITEFSGYPWQGTYYGQHADKDQALSTHQQGQLPIYQQYRKVEWMELLIQSPANPSSEALTQEMSYKLSARMYTNGYLQPLEGDLFVAPLMDGRAGIFAIEAPPVRLSIFKNAVYEIELALYSLVADNREVIDDIERKVVDHTVFIKEYLLNGKDPFLTPKKVVKLGNLRKELDLLERSYYREFYNVKLHTLVLPKKVSSGHYLSIYDKEVVELVSKISRLDHEVQLSRLTINGNNNYQNTERACLFDLLLNRTYRMYGNFVTKMGCFDSERFMGNPKLGGVYMSDLTHYIGPMEDIGGEEVSEAESFNQLGVNVQPNRYGLWINYETAVGKPLKDLFGEVTPEEQEEPPAYHPVLSHDTYILSPAFYHKNEDNYSTLEQILANYLSMGNIAQDQYEVVLATLEEMDTVDRFYLIPLLLFLGRILERSF